MAEEVRVPVMVPYQEEVTVMEDEQILHMVDVTKMVPKIVIENIEEVIPVYKEEEVVTRVPVVVQDCKMVLVDEGRQAVVQNLTYEKVQ